MKTWCILTLMASFLYAMESDSPSHVVVDIPESRRSSDQDDDDFPEAMLSACLGPADERIARRVLPQLQRRLEALRTTYTDENAEVRHELRTLRNNIREQERSGSVTPPIVFSSPNRATQQIGQIMSDSLRDSFEEIEDDIRLLEERARTEQRNKWRASVLGLLGTTLSLGVGLIVHFTKGSSC